MMDDFSKWPSSNTVHGLPRSHWTKHLYNFEDPKPGLVTAVTKFRDAWEKREMPAPRLILTGKAGRGKSHCAIGLYRHGIAIKDASQCKYLSVPEFVAEVKQSYNKNGPEELFEDLTGASMMVLDDLFGADDKHLIEMVVPRLIRIAYDYNQAIVTTSNYTVKEIAGILHPHEMSRLIQKAAEVRMVSDRDYRLSY